MLMPDIPGGHFVAEFPRCRSAAGENRSHVAIGAARQNLDAFVQRLRRHQAQHRSKNFRIRKRAVRRHVIQDASASENSVAIGAPFPVRPSSSNFRAFAGALGDQAFDARLALSGNHRPHADTSSSSPLPTRSRWPLRDLVLECFLRVAQRTATDTARQRCPAQPNALSLIMRVEVSSPRQRAPVRDSSLRPGTARAFRVPPPAHRCTSPPASSPRN